MLADADVEVVWEDGTTDENVSVEMAHCVVPSPLRKAALRPNPRSTKSKETISLPREPPTQRARRLPDSARMARFLDAA
jgi:hypothetical protein